MDTANFSFSHPNGMLYGWFSPAGLQSLVLPSPGRAVRIPVLHSSVNDARVRALSAALERYFAGLQEDFAAIPLDLSKGTPFRRRVWEAARTVSWAQWDTYGGLARRVGRPSAARAVGQALGANPVPIIVPCHRFLGAGGRLGGFSAGLHWKRELLRIEGVRHEP